MAGFPTVQNTGPRFASTATLPRTFTSANGQVIERVTITDQLTIRHDNVTVRDVTVMGGRTYIIHVTPKTDGTCPTNVRIEYTEVDGSNTPPLAYAVRGQGGCGFVFDRSTVINVNRGVNVTSNSTISNSYIEVSDPPAAGDHRNGIQTNGGSNLSFTGNTVICINGACSAAISLFADFAEIHNVDIIGNLVAADGGPVIRGGYEPDNEPLSRNISDVRIIGNHVSRSGGSSGDISNVGPAGQGNVCHSNVWADTGLPTDNSC